MQKKLSDISWNVTEEQYRADKALSYSILAKYERTGFNGIPHLFDKVSSPSLTFGSCVDAIITGGPQEFDNRFFVAEFPSISDNIVQIIKELYHLYGSTIKNLNDILNKDIINLTETYKYQLNWKPETRAKVIKEKGEQYYQLLYLAGNKTIIDTNTYNNVQNAVNALKESETTKYYFAENNPFDNVERYYQLKFKATLNDIDYRCMFDTILVDYANKTIQPIDLKTSHKNEWDFYKSFVEWSYQIQNRLYTRILTDNIRKDDYFKDFIILPYLDIVVCKDSLTPMVWKCPFTFEIGTLYMGRDQQIIMRDPEEIGDELDYYLKNQSKVPIGININEPNDVEEWINKL